MKENLSNFQIKILKTIAENIEKIEMFYLGMLALSVLIAVFSFFIYSRKKEPVLKKYPATAISVGAGLFSLSVFLHFSLVKVIIQGVDLESIIPVLLMFCGYFFPVYISLEWYINKKRGTYFNNIRNNSLLLGLRRGDFGEDIINPSFLFFDPKSLFGDFHVIGGKGSGKTTTFVIPPLQQILCDTTPTRPSVFY